ncbi:NADH dehydrogenase iron-sulfur protein 7 [Nephila pilipes]|uniref:NADH dehydrogenase iron-sulfur protein 7 n=1 Tax=Nephila pilipes TaxID=299642 RepID=A0A8X6UHA0_NEPPI|nr:NADH dehydrogenase iron-sulfur protein 7 [Nephila pilipes]
MATSVFLKGSFGRQLLARALTQSSVTAQNAAASQPAENAPVVRKPYSPFQNTTSKLDYALARVDDLLNWARKLLVVQAGGILSYCRSAGQLAGRQVDNSSTVHGVMSSSTPGPVFCRRHTCIASANCETN